MRVPWDRFHKAYDDYFRWEALGLWVRAIVATEGSAPSWLSATLKQCCPGFILNEALLNESGLLAFRLHEWIHNQVFECARQEGWLDALMFYGVRDFRSQSNWAYSEHCEQEWHRRRPASYPEFEEWLSLARNYNPDQETSVANLGAVVEQYVDWKILACWLEPLLRANIELPTAVTNELERRCPGFLGANSSACMKGSGEQGKTQRCLMAWIEDHFFCESKKEGWFDIVRKQARTHPRYVRIERYSKWWMKSWPRGPMVVYPSFDQWRHTAEEYVED